MKADDWINVEEQLPESKEGQWSKEVIALTDTGDVFKLSCMGSYWQRTKEFIDSGARLHTGCRLITQMIKTDEK
ncbi:TPA: hypothetical protein ACIVL7_002234 [Salmonella enterica subsp. enterica serovar Chester]|uniref:hypothetical protein n=1 Tax=Salmonella TaxID=590 RepID=UPI000B02040F|nr:MULTISPECIES: hypothetical protein [Salmonella]